MNQRLKQFLALALSLSLLPASGCKSGAPAPAAPVMGRYVETKYPLPEPFFEILSLRRSANGSVDLLGYAGEANSKVFLKRYRSTDGGLTWTQQPDTSLLEELYSEESNDQASAAAWAPDGALWFFLYRYSEAGRDPGVFARDADGALEELSWPVPGSSSGSGVRAFAVAENGDLIVDFYSEFLQLDAATGAVKHAYTVKNGNGEAWNDGWALSGNTLALSENDHINFYDLSTGGQTGTVACASGQSAVSMSTTNNYRAMDYGADGALYFTDSTGLYRVVEGSDVLEQAADGGLNSLSAPSLIHLNLAALDGQFLLLAFTEAKRYTLLHYSYDPDTPTLPGSSLSVYSLEDDPLIRQAISQFQNSQPSAYVSYEDSLKTADGGMDAEKLSAFLADLGRVYALERDKQFDDGAQFDDFEFQFGALQWMAASSGLDVGELGFFEGLYCAWTVSRDREDGRIEPMFGLNAFRPLSLLGVSAQSKEGELAADFLRCVLSKDVQSAAVGNGMPVNAAAFDASTKMPKDRLLDGEGRFSFYSTTLSDAEGANVPIQLYVYYPPDAWRGAFADRIRALDTPLLYDETVLQLLIDGTRDYFTGKADLNSTVSALKEKLSLYPAE